MIEYIMNNYTVNLAKCNESNVNYGISENCYVPCHRFYFDTEEDAKNFGNLLYSTEKYDYWGPYEDTKTHQFYIDVILSFNKNIGKGKRRKEYKKESYPYCLAPLTANGDSSQFFLEDKDGYYYVYTEI